MENPEAIIVGGGVIGASILHALARHGLRRTLLLEQATLAGGATGRSGAMVRVYHSNPALSELALASLPAYLNFEEKYGTPCGFVETGSLYFDSAVRRPELAREVERLNRLGAALELVDARAGAERFADVSFDADEIAVYEPQSGYADPVRTTKGMIAAASELGASVRTGVRVEEIQIEAGRVTGVRTREGRLRSSLVVLAGGPWSQALLAPLGLELGLYNKAIQTVRLEAAVNAPGEHPCFFDIRTRSYGRPAGRGSSVVGVAATERRAGPDLELALDLAEAESARELAARRLPGLASRSLGGGVRTVDCYSPDRLGILGPASSVRGLFLAVGWSGAGFKLAPGIGERAAVAILRGTAAAAS